MTDVTPEEPVRAAAEAIVELEQTGDYDFYVQPEQFIVADRALAASGYPAEVERLNTAIHERDQLIRIRDKKLARLRQDLNRALDALSRFFNFVVGEDEWGMAVREYSPDENAKRWEEQIAVVRALLADHDREAQP